MQSSKGKPKMIYEGHSYYQNCKTSNRIYWLCSKNRLQKCNARIITTPELRIVKAKKKAHNHPMDAKDETAVKDESF
jgi:hypothetical protein